MESWGLFPIVDYKLSAVPQGPCVDSIAGCQNRRTSDKTGYLTPRSQELCKFLFIGMISHELFRVLFHWPLNCLFKMLATKKTSKIAITAPLCWETTGVGFPHKGQVLWMVCPSLAMCSWNPLVTGGFPTQRASNVECVSRSWHHHILNWDEEYSLIDIKKWAIQLQTCM